MDINEIAHLESLSTKIISGSVSTYDGIKDPIFESIQRRLLEQRKSLEYSRTAQLWLMYTDMVYILRKFIYAERLGDWDLHLKSVVEMLPYLAASGHNHYTKSIILYLQQMNRLPDTHPTVFEHFKKGMHPIRRSDRKWAGLSTDLVIEQELMRSLKTTGGLTRGSRMTENQRNIWVMSRPSCAQVNNTMQNLTGFFTNQVNRSKISQTQE